MLKKALILLSGTLVIASSGLYYVNCSSHQTSSTTTYKYKKTTNTYQFQKLADDTSNSALPAAGSWKTDFPNVSDSNVLGIAGQFNYFAKNIDSTANNTLNGNFASQNLTTGAWIINGTSNKISYIQQKIIAGDGVQLELPGKKVVLGQSLTYSQNGPTIAGHTIKTAPTSLTQDASDSKYIDIDSEFERLTTNSKVIATNSKNNVPSITKQYGQVTFDASDITAQNNVKYLIVKAGDMPSDWGRLEIKGTSDQQRVVLTIDTSGVNNMTLRYSEINGTENKNILFNFYNSTDNYPVSLNGTSMKAGDYTLKMKVTATANKQVKKWTFTKDFTIKSKQARDLNKSDVDVKANTNNSNWLYILIGAILLIVIIILVAVIILQRKKNSNQ